MNVHHSPAPFSARSERQEPDAACGNDLDSAASDLLTVKNLKTHFFLRSGAIAKAVDNLSFTLRRRRTLAIVGESGSGKSVTARSLLRLVEKPGRIVQGEIRFLGEDLLRVPESQMRALRGNRLGMIFQNPSTSLDPLKTIGAQLCEAIRVHKHWSQHAIRERAEEVLQLVGITEPGALMRRYPCELNAGMIQRIMIAMAISCSPDIVIADEPTTTLGVSVQAQILSVLAETQERLDTGLLLITHDMGVVAEMADDVLVMYAGQAVEYGPMQAVLARPQHPYTIGLIRSVPEIDQDRPRYLSSIPGFPPDLAQLPVGCPFASRCEKAGDVCRQERPSLERVASDHLAACFVAQGRQV